MILQFIVLGVGCGAAGKNNITKANARKHKAMILTASPALPKLNREDRRGSFRKRLAAMHPITMMYEDTRLTMAREMMTLKAMDEPIRTRERRVVKIKLNITALRG